MPRRLWSSLKPSTKQRYRRAGIHPNAYNAGKANLTAARGHARTPEHPGRGISNPAYSDYYAQTQPTISPPQVVEVYAQGSHSDEVKQAIGERVNQMFGDRHKYRGKFLDPDFPPAGYPPAPEDDEIMDILENMDDVELEFYVSTDPSFWWLYYH